MIRSARLALSCVVLSFAAGLPAQMNQGFQIGVTPIRTGESCTVTAHGGVPFQVFHVGLDIAQGPTIVPMLGSVSLGFTAGIHFIEWLAFDASGQAAFQVPVHGNPSYVGNMLYAQAAGSDPSSPSGARLSNALARGFHRATPVPTSTQSLPLGEDSAISVLLPFPTPFVFYGLSYTQVGVASNGLLTFGGVSIDPTEHVSDHLGGLPKIAVLWDDLSPQVAGEVVVRSGPGFFQVCWRNVPQFYVLDSNWATATLYADGVINLMWPSIALQDSLVGVSPGHWLGSYVTENFSDADGRGSGTNGGAVYQQFNPNSVAFNLSGQEITFLPAIGAGYRWIR